MIPPIDPAVVDRITMFLMDRYELRRKPEVSARVLALIVELDRLQRPFPLRRHVAQMLGCSIFSIDYVLSTYLSPGRKLLTEGVLIREGAVARRPSSVRYRYFEPARELREVAGSVPPTAA